MSESPLEILNEIKKITDDELFIHEIKEIKSKSLLHEIATPSTAFSWTFIESRLIRNLIAVESMIVDTMLTDSDFLNKIADPSLRMALAWENIGRLDERTKKEKAFLNAAISYEIAGYQANAACLAKQVFEKIKDNDDQSILKLSSLFLQRKFLLVKKIASEITKEPESVESKYDLIFNTASALAAKGLSEAGRYFLNGNIEFINNSQIYLQKSEKIFADIGCMEESNIIYNIHNLLPIMKKRSTWVNLRNLIPDSLLWIRYLKLLSRGLGIQLLKSTSISEMWPSQIHAIENGLLTTNSKVVKMPTSAGKTRIAELAIIHSLISNPGSKCVYIAPYRALVWELEQNLLNLFSDLGFSVSSVLGSYETDEFEQYLITEADILVTTPEKLDLLLRANGEFFSDVRLFILDEGHIINDERRGIKFELLLTRLKKRLQNARFLFLSAVIPQETLEDFTKWMKMQEGDLIESDWRPSILQYAQFNWVGKRGILRYDTTESNPMIAGFIPGIIEQREFEFVDKKSKRVHRPKFPQISSRAHTAAELAYQFAELGPVLVFCTQKDKTFAVAKSILQRLEYSKLTNDVIPPYFQNREMLRSIIIAEDWFGKDHLITKLLKNGIAIHHGKMPDPLRKAIETDFRDKNFQVMVATNTLAQGVNLPIRTVIIHSTRRFSPETPTRPQRISARDYWNIAGRAGRAGEETEGTIIHIIMTDNDEKDFLYYSQQRKNLEPIQSALYELLDKLYNERISLDEVREILDPEIAALLVEESYSDPDYQKTKELLDSTFTMKQISRYGGNKTKFYDSFTKIADILKNDVSESKFWEVYYKTGLSPRSCEIIKNFVSNNSAQVRNILLKTDQTNLFSVLPILIDFISSLHEMQLEEEFSWDYNDLLIGWLQGKNVYDLSKETDGQSGEELADAIEKFFSYKLPWGVSAFVRISSAFLDIPEKEISSYIKSLPSMIKYGVPTPESSWALIAGIPIRKIAMAIGFQYLSERRNSDYKDFISWITRFNSDILQSRYNLVGPLLDDVNKSLSYVEVNPFLREKKELSEILKEPTWIAGISHEQRRFVAQTARVGETIKLVRDYDNIADRNAIKVYLHEQDLGFIEKKLAQVLGPEMDTGLDFTGKIILITRDRIPQVKIHLEEIY